MSEVIEDNIVNQGPQLNIVPMLESDSHTIDVSEGQSETDKEGQSETDKEGQSETDKEGQSETDKEGQSETDKESKKDIVKPQNVKTKSRRKNKNKKKVTFKDEPKVDLNIPSSQPLTDEQHQIENVLNEVTLESEVEVEDNDKETLQSESDFEVDVGSNDKELKIEETLKTLKTLKTPEPSDTQGDEHKKSPELLVGKIVVLEGADACGKTTQVHALAKLYRSQGYIVDVYDFPRYSETFYGKLIRRFLDGEFGNPNNVDPYVSAMMYAGDRYETRNQIIESRKRGNLVLINRYVPSNIVYNSCKLRSVPQKAAFVKYIEKLEYETNLLPVPDIVVYLDVPTDTSQKLLENRESKDEYEKNVKFQKSVCDEYRKFCKDRSNEGWVMVPCTDNNGLLEPSKITSRIESNVTRAATRIDLIKKPKSTQSNSNTKKKSDVQANTQTNSTKSNISLTRAHTEINNDIKASQPLQPLQPLQQSTDRKEFVGNGGDVDNVKLSKNAQLILKRRQEQRFMNQRGIGNRVFKNQSNVQSSERTQMQKDLLKHISKRTQAGKPEPSKEFMNELNPIVPGKPVSALLLSLEVIERTRKTSGICNAIFGSDVYVKEIYHLFLQKYAYRDLPPKFKQYFRAVMQHYYSGSVTLYPEDKDFKHNLDRALVTTDNEWFESLDKLYNEYKLAIKKDDVNRRWFPEEIIMIASIWKQKISFGEKVFDVVQLDQQRLRPIYLPGSPVSKKYQNVSKYLHDNTPKVGMIKIDL